MFIPFSKRNCPLQLHLCFSKFLRRRCCLDYNNNNNNNRQSYLNNFRLSRRNFATFDSIMSVSQFSGTSKGFRSAAGSPQESNTALGEMTSQLFCYEFMRDRKDPFERSKFPAVVRTTKNSWWKAGKFASQKILTRTEKKTKFTDQQSR